MIKILHLQLQLNLTCGVSKTIYLITKKINEKYDHSVFTFGGDAIKKFRNSGIVVIKSRKHGKGIGQFIKTVFELLSLIKENKYHIIHSHHRYFDLIAYILSRFLRFRTITSVQSKVFGKKPLSYKANLLIACSHSIKQHLLNYFSITPSKIEVIYNFVDLNEVKVSIEKIKIKKELKIPDSAIILGFVGRFNIQEKGIDILLDAFKEIYNEYKNIILLMIGEGEDINYINSFKENTKLDIMVLSPKENIFDYYNIVDVVIIPSRVEPFGIVAIEAGIMKKAVIASEIDGLKEIIDDGINGFLFPNGRVDLLTAKLKNIIIDPQLRINSGEALHRKVMNKFTSDKIIPLYEGAYYQIYNKL